MVNKIAYTKNGNVVLQSYDLRKDPQIYIDKFISKGYADSILVNTDNLPNRNYGDSFEISGNSIVLNLTKAKQNKKNRLKNLSKNKLKNLETLYLEASTKKRNPSVIESRYAYLNGTPKDTVIDAATTIEEIDAIDFDSWTEPVIDDLDEDMSKIATYYNISSEGVSSTTNKNFVQKVRLTFTAKATTYFVFYYSEIYTSSKRKRISTRVQIDDTVTIHESDTIPSSQNLGWGSISGEYIQTFTTGTHNIDFDFSANGATTSVRRTRIYVTEIVSGN